MHPRQQRWSAKRAVRNGSETNRCWVLHSNGGVKRIVLLAMIVAVGGILRLPRLSELSCDYDEGFSRKMLSFGFIETWHRVALDNSHPPLYYYLLRAWSTVFGSSPQALRMMSASLGLVSIIAAHLLVARLEEDRHGAVPGATRNENAAILAALLMALSPLQIALSQQIRMYPLGTALTLLSSWTLLRALGASAKRWQLWCPYVITASLLLYTHYFGLFVVCAQFLYSAGYSIRRGFANERSTTDRWSVLAEVILVFLLIDVLWLPWLPEFLDHQQHVTALFWSRPFTWRQLAFACLQLFVSSWSPWQSSVTGAAVATATYTAAMLALLIVGRQGMRLMGLASVVSFAMAIGFSLYARNIITARYFAFAHVLALCGIAAALGRTSRGVPRLAFSACLLFCASWACCVHVEQRELVSRRPGLVAAMAYLADVRKPSEPLIVANPMLQIAAVAHAVGSEDVYVLSQSTSFPFFHGAAVMRNDEYLSPEELITSRARKLWVIDAVNWIGRDRAARIPAPWVDVSEEVFPEQLSPSCKIVVRCCMRPSS